MSGQSAQNLLSAQHGGQRVTIGVETPEVLRALSDARQLQCPVCGAPVTLHAGTVRAHHFAHLPGAICTLPQSEPETEEHRAGKLLLAAWLRAQLPESTVVVEAFLPETKQRADVLATLPGRHPRRIALEYQCANLSAREWRRRHHLYRASGVQDLWLLGGSRLIRESNAMPPVAGETSPEKRVTLRTGELERALLWDGAPALFLDSIGENLAAGTLARFRPHAESQAHRPTGRLSARSLLELAFPWTLLDWPQGADPHAPTAPVAIPNVATAAPRSATATSDGWLWEWLTQRYRVTPETLPGFFGLPIFGQEVFACAPAAWQAAVYYRFVHRRVGDGWWLTEVETWARGYLPLTRPANLRRLHSALADYQEVLAAAGFLSLPMGYGRLNARIVADLTTLPTPPDREETLRLARYRRTLSRENRTSYGGKTL